MPLEIAAEMVKEAERNLRFSSASQAATALLMRPIADMAMAWTLQVTGEPPCPQVAHRFAAALTFESTDTGLWYPVCVRHSLRALLESWAGMPTKGNGFFAQDVDLSAMRMETIRPSFLGKMEGMATNLTMLTLGQFQKRSVSVLAVRRANAARNNASEEHREPLLGPHRGQPAALPCASDVWSTGMLAGTSSISTSMKIQDWPVSARSQASTTCLLGPAIRNSRNTSGHTQLLDAAASCGASDSGAFM